ncbi:hypothetical protein ACFWWB_23805 [Streptomyces sp. NPDC058690]|uniref:hypothetical protein n=1 Tax=Streptomyces sp. NPDC058690 TaxID=3346600 RepID=UPI00365A3F57
MDTQSAVALVRKAADACFVGNEVAAHQADAPHRNCSAAAFVRPVRALEGTGDLGAVAVGDCGEEAS